MKITISACVLILATATCFAQKPAWVNDEFRSGDYPRSKYLTGYAVNTGANSTSFAAELKASAKSELIEGIMVSVSSAKTMQKSERAGVFTEDYTASSATFANADINGLKIEYYYDAPSRTGMAFAWADKAEVKGFYSATIAMAIQRADAMLQDGYNAEVENNKSRAKKEYETALALLQTLALPQSLLIAIDGGDTPAAQSALAQKLLSEARSAVSRMQSAIKVCVIAKEDNFGQPVSLLSPKLKAELSNHGCSFTENKAEADWLLYITASTRKGSDVDGIFFAYLDAETSLIEQRTGREIYRNAFTDIKGGGLDYTRAGLKAYNGGLQNIVAQLVKNIEK